MAGIGSVVNTPHGPVQVLSVFPGKRRIAGETVRDALTQPLTEAGAPTNAATASARPPVARFDPRADAPPATAGGGGADHRLSLSQRQKLQELQAIDRAVKAEERQHAAAAGAYGSTPQYQTVTGPDGRQYAVAGSVSVSSAAAVTPEEHQSALARIKGAAVSVLTPSSADLSAAASAASRQAGPTAGGGESLFRQAASAYRAVEEPPQRAGRAFDITG